MFIVIHWVHPRPFSGYNFTYRPDNIDCSCFFSLSQQFFFIVEQEKNLNGKGCGLKRWHYVISYWTHEIWQVFWVPKWRSTFILILTTFLLTCGNLELRIAASCAFVINLVAKSDRWCQCSEVFWMEMENFLQFDLKSTVTCRTENWLRFYEPNQSSFSYNLVYQKD